MPTITKTIGAAGDYTTLQAWADDLSNAVVYTAGDTAEGVVIDLVLVGHVVLPNTALATLVTLAPLAAIRHAGKIGTGCTLQAVGTSPVVDAYHQAYEFHVSDFEVDWLKRYGPISGGIQVGGAAATGACTVSGMLLYGFSLGGSSNNYGILSNGYSTTVTIKNCAVFGMRRNTSFGGCAGIYALNSSTTVTNCLVFDTLNYNNGTGNGIYASTSAVIKNCVSVGNGGDDYYLGSASSSNNADSDGTAPGTSNVNNITHTDEFETLVGGDPHLKTGSSLIGQGVAVSGVVNDIDGDAWSSPPSIGCDEWISEGITSTPTTSFFAAWDTEYYCDSEGGSDLNDGLTPGTAWETIAHSIATIPFASGVRTRLNLKARATAYDAEDLDSNNNTNRHHCVQGYTTTAGDGGKATITRSAGSKCFKGTSQANGNHYFSHLIFSGTGLAISTDAYARMWCEHCTFIDASVIGSYTRSFYHLVVACTFTATANYLFSTYCDMFNCLIDCRNMTTQLGALNVRGNLVTGCVFLGTSGVGILNCTHNKYPRILRNLFIGDGGGTAIDGSGFQTSAAVITNNCFVNFTTAIEGMATPPYINGNNLFFGCGTNNAASSPMKLPDFVADYNPVPNWETGDYRVHLPANLEYATDLIPSNFGPAAVALGGGSAGNPLDDMKRGNRLAQQGITL